MKKIKSFSKLFAFVSLAILVNLVFASAITFSIGSPEYTSELAVGLTAFTFGMVAYQVFIKKSEPVRGALFAFTQGICEKIQTSLIEILGNKAPSLTRTKVGYLQALTSPQNTAGVTILPVDPGNGKNKSVKIKFIQRGIEDDITETPITDCSTTLEKTPFEDTKAVTRYIGTKGMKFDENEMRKLCEADADYMAAQINSMIDPLIVQLNKKLLTLQAANFGLFVPDVSPDTYKELQLLKNSGEDMRYKGESDLMLDMENAGVSGRPILVGAGNIYHYAQMAKIGCCNDGGLNLGNAAAFDYFFDKHAGAILGGDNRVIAMAPGYVQLLTWNKYVGTYKKENDVFSHGTIMDPITGLVFDMKWHYNDCDDTYSVHFFLNYDIYFIPATAFATGDELEGVNYTWLYDITDGSAYL